MAEFLAFAGELPADVHPHVRESFGLKFKKRAEHCNGRPAYVSTDGKQMLWHAIATDGANAWIVGKVSDAGKWAGGIAVVERGSGSSVPEHITSVWQVWSSTMTIVMAPALRLLHSNPATAPDDAVTVTRVRTREERDLEGRRHAIDINLFDPKRRRTVACAVETRVAKARSACTESIDKRVIELLQPAVEQFVKGEIDSAELAQRKEAARREAEAEHAPLSQLDKCFEKYTAAIAARVQAEDAVLQATETEDTALAELDAAVRALLPAEAGPSGVVKGE